MSLNLIHHSRASNGETTVGSPSAVMAPQAHFEPSKQLQFRDAMRELRMKNV